MKKRRSRATMLGAAVLLTLATLGCALMQQPTPVVLPTPSPTPAASAEDATPTPSPAVATATPAPADTTSPTPTASPTATPAPPTPTPQPPAPTWTPEPAPTATLAPEAIRIQFAAGTTSAALTGSLAGGVSRTYALGISAGQLVDIVADSQQTLQMAIRGADGVAIKPLGQPFFRGTVPTTQDYLVTLTAPTAPAEFALTIIIPVRITFAPGGTTTQLQATLEPFTTGHYVIRALGGQTMTVDTTTTQGEVITIVYGADGMVLQTDHAGAPDFTGTLPSTQDYLIHLRSVGAVSAVVTIDVTIPPP